MNVIANWWRGNSVLIRRIALTGWILGGGIMVLGVFGDVRNWWGGTPFLTNMLSAAAGALFGIPVALLFVQSLASAQAKVAARTSALIQSRTLTIELEQTLSAARLNFSNEGMTELKVLRALLLDAVVGLQLRATDAVRADMDDPRIIEFAELTQRVPRAMLASLQGRKSMVSKQGDHLLRRSQTLWHVLKTNSIADHTIHGLPWPFRESMSLIDQDLIRLETLWGQYGLSAVASVRSLSRLVRATPDGDPIGLAGGEGKRIALEAIKALDVPHTYWFTLESLIRKMAAARLAFSESK